MDILCIVVEYYLILSYITEPGIIPRKCPQYPIKEIEQSEENEKDENKYEEIPRIYTERRCDTCQIMRPPGASHCFVCDNCVHEFDLIIDISLDIPNIFDIYAYVLKIILKNYMIEFTDLNELNKGEETLKHINEVMKHLRNYYQEDEKEEDFLEKLKELSYVKNNEDLFAWAFEDKFSTILWNKSLIQIV